MLGIIYLIVAVIVGFEVSQKYIPQVLDFSGEKSLFNEDINIPRWMMIFPISFFIGILLMIWITYISTYILRNSLNPMLYGNSVAGLLAAVYLFFTISTRRKSNKELINDIRIRESKYELSYILVCTVFWGFYMLRSFNIRDGSMNVGYSVYSDFGPHLAMIRSFSKGLNFPSQYPHFAGDTMKYHFLFQYLAGNLEYLGLRIDWAFNLISIMSIVCFFALLYCFSVYISGKRQVAVLTAILCLFRSSFAVFTYLKSKGTLVNALKGLKKLDVHIGGTLHEEWGLWTQKVYVNQRHFSFALGIMMIILIFVMPLLKNMFNTINNSQTIKEKLNNLFIKRDSWKIKNLKSCLFMGVILGLIGFVNGAVLIATLSILFFMAIFSKNRFNYLIIAIVSGILFYVQIWFFGAMKGKSYLQLTVGFLANPKTLQGIYEFYIMLFGILPCVLIIAVLLGKKGMGILVLAFSMPFVVANLIQITPDVTVNHKYIMISCILWNIVVADFLYQLFFSEYKRRGCRIIATVLISLLTVTGVIDAVTLYNLDESYVEYSLNNPLYRWIENKTDPKEIFLTDMYVVHPILLGGRKIYYGWPYFTWSAGYDIDARSKIVNSIYSAKDKEELKFLVNSENISYIVIEEENRVSQYYDLNEELIRDTFELAYEDDRVMVYKTLIGGDEDE